MIRTLSDVPAGVIGFEVAGKIEPEDYRDVVLPAVERAAQSGEVRFLIVMPRFEGMSAGAVWQDLKVGVEHFRAWKRIAVVTDVFQLAPITSQIVSALNADLKLEDIAEELHNEIGYPSGG